MTATTAVPGVFGGARARAGYRRRQLVNNVMLGLTGLLTLLAVIPLVWVVLYVTYRGLQYLSWAFFTQMPRPLGIAGGGVLHAIEGTIVLTTLAAVFAIPPGVVIGFFVAQDGDSPLGVTVRFATDVLAGVPSIIIGLFVYVLVVKVQGHYSAFAGGVALAVLMLPIVIRTTEEMIKLVPHSLREASLALGASDWKTSLSVVLPAAADGIMTGIILGIARASGETAPVLFTALGNDRYELGALIKSGLAQHHNPLQILTTIVEQPIDSLPLTLWKYAQQPYPERINQAWTAALVLMAMVLAMNLVARLWLRRRAMKLRG
jgi:phosphate transport system permease protein